LYCGYSLNMRLLSTHQRCSIRFKLGEYAGQTIDVM
jgi:hypothetical protein